MDADPLSLFRAAADALLREEWRAVAGLCDPASLATFRRQMLEGLEPAEPPPRLTVERYLRHQPDMPPEVAEYHVAQHNAWSDPAQRLLDELPGIGSTDELRARSPEDVFAAWLEGRSPRHQLRRMVARKRMPPADADRLAGTLPFEVGLVALGAVADGERLAHVVFLRKFRSAGGDAGDDGDPALERLPEDERELARDLSGREHPQVATCRRQPDGGWRMLAQHDFLGLGGFVFSVEPDDPEPSGGEPG